MPELRGSRRIVDGAYLLALGICAFAVPVPARAAVNVAIDNHTASVAVSEANLTQDTNGTHVKFRLLNQTNKVIASYKISMGGSTLFEEFTPPRTTGLAPGAEDQRTLAIAAADRLDLPHLAFRVCAVLFADGSANGDPDSVEELGLLLQGRLFAARAMHPVLEDLMRAVSSNTSDNTGAVMSTLDQLAHIPEQDSTGRAATGLLASGFRGAVGAVISELSSTLENHLPSESIRSAVSAIVGTQWKVETTLEQMNEGRSIATK